MVRIALRNAVGRTHGSVHAREDGQRGREHAFDRLRGGDQRAGVHGLAEGEVRRVEQARWPSHWSPVMKTCISAA